MTRLPALGPVLYGVHETSGFVYLKTHIDIDGDVLASVQELGGFATKREAVNAASTELARELAARKLLDMRGKLAWAGELDDRRRARFPEWDLGR